MRLFAAAMIATALTLPSIALAAPVNCSYNTCLKECQRRGNGTIGCSTWCSKTMAERQNAGQCPRK